MRFTGNIAARTATAARQSPVRARTTVVAPPNEISHDIMRRALDAGDAVTLTPAITDIARHDDSWWLFDRDSWLRVTDVDLSADLDAFAIRAARR